MMVARRLRPLAIFASTRRIGSDPLEDAGRTNTMGSPLLTVEGMFHGGPSLALDAEPSSPVASIHAMSSSSFVGQP